MKQKFKRLLTSLLFPVSTRRIGACNSCGDCCKLPNICPFLGEKTDGENYCKVYFFRPPSCRKYPRVESEFITPENCGYSFVAENVDRSDIIASSSQ